MDNLQNSRITMHYKNLQDSPPISLDVYFPSTDTEVGSIGDASLIPAVIYFHGGGLTVGNRGSWFPAWLQKRVISLGYAFISADYRLIPPSTGHDIVKDIQDLFTFIKETEMKNGLRSFKVDPNKIAVSGSSAGGLCAYLAATHCVPKPKALVSIYGMGGNFFTSHYLKPKEEIFFRGRELLESSDFSEYLYPYTHGTLSPISDSPLAYHPQTYHIPGYPANKRMLLARLYLQLGTFLDYYTGMHSPSLSKLLLDILETEGTPTVEDYKRLIPQGHRSIFPQLGVNRTWPATILLHGTADSAVPIEESRHMRQLLEDSQVPVELLEFSDKEHSFDYEPGAEEEWKEKFDGVKDFLHKWLRLV
ncbi:hypothetical protein GALMADRAFT_859394 [Galerina marginata CBS 339.88]|uniref:Alpha/beta hydrolase fold-3 domain-containing protein n=1 Tax=Galerina marginata (strain CBS 339.88) TaxID=685588 RepID=A0A067TKU1_GALM3|nr:hypothetical protein GALMADRAFT_859394 [Galerina marginata CBS 339.88]